MKFKNQKLIRKGLLIFSVLLFISCSCFLIYYLIIQPRHSKQVNDKYKDIYYSSENSASEALSEKEYQTGEPETEMVISLEKGHKGEKNADGILVKFSKLLEYNKDIKGWLTIPGTGIDYPVMQNKKEDYYLTRDFEKKKDKNGSLYIDEHCSIENTPKNIVIHGHNMETTKMMFYELPNYKDINYYMEHPILTFDTIYEESQWKIISFMRVSGSSSDKGSFNYMQGDFKDTSAFLDFVYQIEMRSLYHCPVDVNENDSLLMLSTCSYEVKNYRTVLVARKLRHGESKKVDSYAAYKNKNVLYPNSWYSKYGGEAPVVTNFSDAMSFGEIDWYDGSIETDDAVGTTVETDDFIFEITSPTTLTLTKCKNKKATTLSIPSDIEQNGRQFDVTKISKDCFTNMKKLQALKIGNKLTEIPAKAFIHCTSLESIIIGDSVSTIGKKAFYKLKNLRKIKIRCTKLESVDEKAFQGIYEKAKFKLPKKNYKKYQKMIQQSKVSDKAKFVQYEEEDASSK